MSPPPLAAVVLLGAWALALFATTSATAYYQWRANGGMDATDYGYRSHSRPQRQTPSDEPTSRDRSSHETADRFGSVSDD
ncbi:hypothetical protein RBH26_08550 [Natronolimnohabitans sp. A-GB9]|uniref:hypothetical protein n=1 Tax=Natronolimnohabitans sp. A-GB9 TaxID=3069757 RepID=UPI0027B7895E|nr:hypothetical protein [Natronolimnohabitans sp. A-GB9]MDQ2050536.1 hypothetical protein [Natronolimnohabitans sp. A-GB9]